MVRKGETPDLFLRHNNKEALDHVGNGKHLSE